MVCLGLLEFKGMRLTQPYNSYKVSLDNLVVDQLIIPKLIFSFVLIACLIDIVKRNSVLVTHGS